MGILENHLTPENIQNTPIDELFEIIKDKSHNKLTMKFSVTMRRLIVTSIQFRESA